MSTKKILITGGTGLLGSHLLKVLESNRYDVALLSRNPDHNSFVWNIETNFIDPEALQETDTIIHLAGASIAEGRWTSKRKQEIIESRVKSTELLFDKLKNGSHGIKTFISASGIGIYGNRGDDLVDEQSHEASDFPSNVCIAWENAVQKIASLGIRVVILRIGIVLANDGGALPQLALPIRFFAGCPLGSGKQYLSWIHVNDLCSIFQKALVDEKMTGVYNAVAPNPITNKEMMQSLAKILHRPLMPFNLPAFFLQFVLGEKSTLILSGQKVSSKKIMNTGFEFEFEKIKDALENLYQKPLTVVR